MLVRETMTTGLVTARESDLIQSVVLKMVNRNCGIIPVVDDMDHLLGVIALRDILLPLYPNYGDYIHDNVHSRDFVAMEDGYPDVLNKRAADLMTRNPLTVSPDDPILKAASLMGLKNLRRIPVVEDDRLVGIVSISDINRGLCVTRGLCALR
ncbi:MAG: CBS domain-containing protein [Deltaproteobacteria bacterium]|nr:MAG: CBS domain-containing protein [Deltaproteobacteria bacterium]